MKISGWHAPSPPAVLTVFLPIFSLTLIVVVQWPKFGHSTTLNNKGYKAHKEMGHVPKLSSHPNLYLVKISGWHVPSPTSCANCFSPIFSHTLIVIVVVQWPKFGHSTTLSWITRAKKHTKRWDMSHNLAHIPTCIWWKYQVNTAPSPTRCAKCFSPVLFHTLIVVV